MAAPGGPHKQVGQGREGRCVKVCGLLGKLEEGGKTHSPRIPLHKKGLFFLDPLRKMGNLGEIMSFPFSPVSFLCLSGEKESRRGKENQFFLSVAPFPSSSLEKSVSGLNQLPRKKRKRKKSDF